MQKLQNTPFHQKWTRTKSPPLHLESYRCVVTFQIQCEKLQSRQLSVASCGVDKDSARLHRPGKCNGAGLSITSPKPQGGQQGSLCSVGTVFDGQGEVISTWLGGSLIHTDGCKRNKFREMLALWPRSKERRRDHLACDRDRASSRLSGDVEGGVRCTDQERLERPGTVSSRHVRLDNIEARL